MWDALQAQSMGLTTSHMPSANPAATLATLTATDVQTGAGQTPGMKEPAFSAAQDTRTNSTPLGVQEQLKIPLSVEASQLTRALTLAELSIKTADNATEATSAKCGCLLTRPDLAFMFLAKGTDPSKSVLEANAFGATTPEQVPQKIDAFLWNLYKTLDDEHQSLEEKLRGKTEIEVGDTWEVVQSPIRQGGAGQATVVAPPVPSVPPLTPGTVGGPPAAPDRLSPPFDATSRYAVKDPKAAEALANTTSEQGLGDVYNKFANDLVRDLVIKVLTTKLENLNKRIAQLEKDLAALDARANPQSATFRGDRESLLKDLAKLKQERDNTALRLEHVRNGGEMTAAEVQSARQGDSTTIPQGNSTYGSGVPGATKS